MLYNSVSYNIRYMKTSLMRWIIKLVYPVSLACKLSHDFTTDDVRSVICRL